MMYSTSDFSFSSESCLTVCEGFTHIQCNNSTMYNTMLCTCTCIIISTMVMFPYIQCTMYMYVYVYHKTYTQTCILYMYMYLYIHVCTTYMVHTYMYTCTGTHVCVARHTGSLPIVQRAQTGEMRSQCLETQAETGGQRSHLLASPNHNTTSMSS